MNDVLPKTAYALRRRIERGEDLVGAQVSAWIGGEEVATLAVGQAGLGRPMQSSTVFRVHCALKPVVSLAVTKLVEDGHVGWDESLRSLVPGVRCVAENHLSLRQLLMHSAGLHAPTGVQFELALPQHREALLRAMPVAPRWTIGVDRAYSEVLAWYLIGWLIETVTGEDVQTYLRRTILDPLGLTSTWIGMTAEEYAANVDGLGVHIDLREEEPLPLLMERSERVCCEVNCSSGGYSNASDLGRLYAALLTQLDQRSVHDALPAPDVLAMCCSAAGPAVYDRFFRRPCSYGLGFMVNQYRGWWSTCSSSTFGHFGMFGCPTGLADPERDLALGVVLNGITDSYSTDVRQSELLESVYADLRL